MESYIGITERQIHIGDYFCRTSMIGSFLSCHIQSHNALHIFLIAQEIKRCQQKNKIYYYGQIVSSSVLFSIFVNLLSSLLYDYLNSTTKNLITGSQMSIKQHTIVASQIDKANLITLNLQVAGLQFSYSSVLFLPVAFQILKSKFFVFHCQQIKICHGKDFRENILHICYQFNKLDCNNSGKLTLPDLLGVDHIIEGLISSGHRVFVV